MTDTDRGLHSEAEQAEILSKEVRLDGVGEDPVIKALVSDKFVDAPDHEAFDVGAALRDLIRGQARLIENQKKQEEDLQKMRAWMVERDAAAKQFEEDPVKFAQDINSRADNLRVSGLAKDKVQAKFAQDVSKISREVQAQIDMKAAEELQDFRAAINKADKVTIYSSGKQQRVRIGDSFDTRTEPETIDVAVGKKTFRWTLIPGKPNLVPDFIAKEYYARKEMAVKRDELKDALRIGESGTMQDYGKVTAKFPELDIRRRPDNIIEMGGTFNA